MRRSTNQSGIEKSNQSAFDEIRETGCPGGTGVALIQHHRANSQRLGGKQSGERLLRGIARQQAYIQAQLGHLPSSPKKYLSERDRLSHCVLAESVNWQVRWRSLPTIIPRQVAY